MKKICSLPFTLIFFLTLFTNGCVAGSEIPVLVILILCLLVIIIYSFLLLKKNHKALSLNNDLEQIISDKTEELKIQNSIVSVNNHIIMSKKTELEEILKTKVEELCHKDDLMFLNSRQASMGELMGFIGHQWKQNIYAISLYTEALKNILMQKGTLDIDTAKDPLDKIDSFIIEMYNNLNDFTDFVNGKVSSKKSLGGLSIIYLAGIGWKIQHKQFFFDINFDGGYSWTFFSQNEKSLTFNVNGTKRKFELPTKGTVIDINASIGFSIKKKKKTK